MNSSQPDDQQPYDHLASAAQAEAVVALLPKRSRVLDLGCGVGRVASQFGTQVELVGVDRDEKVLSVYEEQTGGATVCLDVVSSMGDLPAGPFDAVLMLGNTLMEITQPLDAYRLFEEVAERLAEGGSFVIDDFSVDLWRDVSEGLWCNGIDESGFMQMVWAEGDPVFTLRYGDDVDPDSTNIRAGERRFRLYSVGELRLFCALNGLAPPTHDPAGHVMTMERVLRLE